MTASMRRQAIEQLARLHGVADAYLDYKGEPRQVSMESQAAILSALGIDAAGEQAEAAIHQHETMRWTRLAPPVIAVRQEQAVIVPVAVPVELGAKTIQWTATLEDGS